MGLVVFSCGFLLCLFSPMTVIGLLFCERAKIKLTKARLSREIGPVAVKNRRPQITSSSIYASAIYILGGKEKLFIFCFVCAPWLLTESQTRVLTRQQYSAKHITTMYTFSENNKLIKTAAPTFSMCSIKTEQVKFLKLNCKAHLYKHDLIKTYHCSLPKNSQFHSKTLNHLF